MTEPEAKLWLEHYDEARRKAQIDLDNWPDSIKHENRSIWIIISLGLGLALFIVWFGIYRHVDQPVVNTHFYTLDCYSPVNDFSRQIVCPKDMVHAN